METVGRTKRPRRSFTKEFKAEIIELVRREGNTPASAARDLDLTETAVRSGGSGLTSTTAAMKDALALEVAWGTFGGVSGLV